MMENANPQKNPVTTLLGVIAVSVALSMYLVPMYWEVKNLPAPYVPATIGLVGLLLIGAPDALFGSIGNLFKRKSDQL